MPGRPLKAASETQSHIITKEKALPLVPASHVSGNGRTWTRMSSDVWRSGKPVEKGNLSEILSSDHIGFIANDKHL